VAEQRIEQEADVAVDDPHVRLPAAVEGDVERQPVGPGRGQRIGVRAGRDQHVAKAVDDAEAGDRILEGRLEQRRLVQVLARLVERIQQPLEPVDVGHRGEAVDEARLDRRDHIEIGHAAELTALDHGSHEDVPFNAVCRRP
jgi:hypothetical protein